MENKRLYIFSGLGADERVFRNLNLTDYTVVHIPWTTPEKEDTLKSYSKRIANDINDLHPILIGLSFGGVMAIEVSKYLTDARIILISSIKSREEMPFYFKWSSLLLLHKLIPDSFLKKPDRLSYWLFGITQPEHKLLFKDVLGDSDLIFVRWAIDQLVKWKNDTIPDKLIHIHGNSDRLIPIRFVKVNHEIRRGGHWMVLEQYNIIEPILKTCIEQISREY